MADPVINKCPTDGNIGTAPGCGGCPNQQQCISSQEMGVDLQNKIHAQLSHLKNIYVIMSGKGGVGKSLVASEFAYALAMKGHKVGLIDLDITGPSLAITTGTESISPSSSLLSTSPIYVHDNLSVISTGNYEGLDIQDPFIRSKYIQQFLLYTDWSNSDILVLDTPPGSTDEHVLLKKYLDHLSPSIILVTTPHKFSISNLYRSIDFCIRAALPIHGYILTMTNYICGRCKAKQAFLGIDKDKADNSELDKLTTFCEEKKISFLGEIPYLKPFAIASDKGIYVTEVSHPDTHVALTILDEITTRMLVS